MDSYQRDISDTIIRYASKFRVVALLGPRQSGKTFIAKKLFPTYKYVNLENADIRFAASRILASS